MHRRLTPFSGVFLFGCTLAGCRALLDADEVTFESSTGSAGGGAGTGAGGNGTTDSASSSSGTSTSTSTSTSTGQGGFSNEPPCTTMTVGECQLPANADELYHFEQACTSQGPWCYYAPRDGSTLDQENGSLIIASDGLPGGTGWWTSGGFAPLLFKTTANGAEFVVVTRVTVSGNLGAPSSPNSDFKVAGLLLRESVDPPLQADEERFFKLEYGYLGTSDAGASNGFGFLWAQSDMGAADHLRATSTPTNEAQVGLAACRRGGVLQFFTAVQGAWQQMMLFNAQDTVMSWPEATTFSIGLSAGTFNANGGTTTGTFDYFGVRTGTAMNAGDCITAVEDLDTALTTTSD